MPKLKTNRKHKTVNEAAAVVSSTICGITMSSESLSSYCLSELMNPELHENIDETITIDRLGELSPEDNLLGTVLADKYEILEVLGKGGMSVVYRARHVVMDKTLAVKVLHMDLARDEVSLRRFNQEAQASSQLSHPGIVGVYDCGKSESGMPYLVMDLVEGPNLSDVIRQEGPLKLERFLPLMQQVVAALTQAHKSGIVHRDLKPSNIMIASSGDHEQAKIVDFGIAKIVSQEGQNQQQLTQTGEVFGSPLYMSPEQCSGGQVDHRCDIYSLGCVMYEALSGQLPLRGNSVVETIHKHINESPPPLVADQLDPESKRKLELMLLRCLAKLPEDRYQSMSEIESELRALSLKTKTGIFAKVGGAWDLASAKRRAARKTRVPLLIGGLAISMLSILVLLCGLYKADRELEEITRTRKLFNSICWLQADFVVLGEKTRLYFSSILFQKSDISESRREFEGATARVDKRLKAIEPLLELDANFSKSYRERYRARLKSVPDMASVSVPALDRAARYGMESIWNPETIAIVRHLDRVCEDGSKVLIDIARQARKIEHRQDRQLSETKDLIRLLAISCALINGSVMTALIVYFAGGNKEERMRKLAEHAAQLSEVRGLKMQSNSQIDEVAELDNVLNELATALSEAEEREKALKQKLLEQENKAE